MTHVVTNMSITHNLSIYWYASFSQWKKTSYMWRIHSFMGPCSSIDRKRAQISIFDLYMSESVYKYIWQTRFRCLSRQLVLWGLRGCLNKKRSWSFTQCLERRTNSDTIFQARSVTSNIDFTFLTSKLLWRSLLYTQFTKGRTKSDQMHDQIITSNNDAQSVCYLKRPHSVHYILLHSYSK